MLLGLWILVASIQHIVSAESFFPLDAPCELHSNSCELVVLGNGMTSLQRDAAHGYRNLKHPKRIYAKDYACERIIHNLFEQSYSQFIPDYNPEMNSAIWLTQSDSLVLCVFLFLVISAYMFN